MGASEAVDGHKQPQPERQLIRGALAFARHRTKRTFVSRNECGATTVHCAHTAWPGNMLFSKSATTANSIYIYFICINYLFIYTTQSFFLALLFFFEVCFFSFFLSSCIWFAVCVCVLCCVFGFVFTSHSTRKNTIKHSATSQVHCHTDNVHTNVIAIACDMATARIIIMRMVAALFIFFYFSFSIYLSVCCAS